MRTFDIMAVHIVEICHQAMRSLGGPMMSNGVDLTRFTFQLSTLCPTQVVAVEADLLRDLRKCLN